MAAAEEKAKRRGGPDSRRRKGFLVEKQDPIDFADKFR